jgi:hypothetical protein
MNKRLLLFIIGLVILSVVTIVLVDVVIPEHGAVALPRRFEVPGRLPNLGPGPVPGRILTLPSDRALPGLWLRPFGLHRSGLPGILWHVGSFVALLVLAVFALYLTPQRLTLLSQVVSESWGQTFLAFVVGLLALMGAVLLSFLLFVNVVGWPLVPIMALGIYLATAFGLVAVSLALGNKVSSLFRLDGRGPLFHLVIGIVLIFLVSMIPYLGWVIVGVCATIGFGAVLWTRGGGTSGWSLDEAQ